MSSIHLEVARNKRIGRGTVIETACGRKWNGWNLKSRKVSTDPNNVTCGLCRRSLLMIDPVAPVRAEEALF